MPAIPALRRQRQKGSGVKATLYGEFEASQDYVKSYLRNSERKTETSLNRASTMSTLTKQLICILRQAHIGLELAVILPLSPR